MLEQSEAIILNEILRESLEEVRLRERNAFSEQAGPFERSIVLFGAGSLGRQLAQCLRRDGIEPLAFSDNNPSIWNTEVEGIRVLSPQDAASKLGDRAAFVVSIWNTNHRFVETRDKLRSMGCQCIIPGLVLRWRYAEDTLPLFWADLPSRTVAHAEEIRAAFDHWSDSFSKSEYLAQLKWRIWGDFDGLSAPVEDSYFLPGLFTLNTDECFLDGGAYDGVTIRDFLPRVSPFQGKILAVEPDPLNCGMLKEYVKNLPSKLGQRIQIIDRGLWNRCESIRFNVTGTMGSSIVESGGVELDCVTLDQICIETGMAPSFIKLDIEGAEIKALLGGARLLKETRPILAVCVYHCFDHLWAVAECIHRINPDYRLYLRVHEPDGWQLVLYAVPPERTLVGA